MLSKRLRDVSESNYKGSTKSFYNDLYSAAFKENCVDTDGGLNYSLKGSVTWKQEDGVTTIFTDRALGKKELLEFYCEDNHLYAKSITCPIVFVESPFILDRMNISFDDDIVHSQKINAPIGELVKGGPQQVPAPTSLI